MGPLVATSSVLVAFVGGMLALAAPCCVTYLLPAYLASVYRAKRAVLAMTFVFAAGIAVVLLPLVLGVAALANFFGTFHTEVFIVGGVFLLFLGVWSLSGRNLALPMRPAPTGNYGVASVFGLGVFSGAASSCCAPVLAGVLTLSAVSSSLPQALTIGGAYILGMVAPLLVLAYFWDRLELANHPIVRGRRLRFRLGPVRRSLHSTNLLAGVLFVAMGVLIITLAYTGQATNSPEAQVRVSAALTRAAEWVTSPLGGVPDVVVGTLLGGIVAYLLVRAFPGLARPLRAIASSSARAPMAALRRIRRRATPPTARYPQGEPASAPTALEEVHHG